VYAYVYKTVENKVDSRKYIREPFQFFKLSPLLLNFPLNLALRISKGIRDQGSPKRILLKILLKIPLFFSRNSASRTKLDFVLPWNTINDYNISCRAERCTDHGAHTSSKLQPPKLQLVSKFQVSSEHYRQTRTGQERPVRTCMLSL
jgi:hypothetical protein